MTDTEKNLSSPQIGRNEPCPCGSGKKYKRCCGVSAAPKLTPPSAQQPGFDPSQMPNYDPQMMAQFAQAFQRLPKGQLQRLQSIMQRAMSGKDVTREASELESSLPPDFQEMLKGFSAAGMPGMPGMPGIPGGDAAAFPALPDVTVPSMTEEEARALVAKAAAEGKISDEQAQGLLDAAPQGETPSQSAEEAKGIGKFFRKLGGKKD